jgi:beta-lactamase superfamily II metal-dependent hydrolase
MVIVKRREKRSPSSSSPSSSSSSKAFKMRNKNNININNNDIRLGFQSKKGNIRVRMYRVGFGDCFLVSLPALRATSTNTTTGATHEVGIEDDEEGTDSKEYTHHILIDFGVHAGGDIGTIEKVIQNIIDVTDRKLAVIIATHAHRDHIYGFGKFKDEFSQFKIGEIWLPWTWDDGNENAVRIKKKHATLINGLSEHFEAQGMNPKGVVDLTILNALENMKGNKLAIKLLKSGFADEDVKVRYLKAGDSLKSSQISIHGLHARLLGPPPPQSEEFLAQMDPPSGQSYLMLRGGHGVSNKIQPFAKKWLADADSIPLKLNAEDEKILQELASSSISDLAFTLDKALNNESLVVLLIFRDNYLLFPGDAQYGSWRWWLENDSYSSTNILQQIRFLKVAHHGSHNATPKAALEKMTNDKFAAMVSTQSEPWPSIPRVPLMHRLSEKTRKRIVRSDWLPVTGAPKPLHRARSSSLPSKLPMGFTKGDFWFDYTIEL